MRYPSGPRRRPGRWATVVAGLIVVIGLSVPVTASATAPLAASMAVGTGPAASTTFAARAGFASWEAAETEGATPLERPLSVDVVFDLTNTSVGATPGPRPQTAAEFAQVHGLTPGAYAAAESYFRSEGLSVTQTWPDRLVLSLAGAPTALDRAFSTSLYSGTYSGRPVVYPVIAPSLPSPLESEVAGVVGLSTGYTTFSIALSPVAPAAGPAAATSFTPGNARSLYGLSDLYNLSGGASFATGESIALVLWGDGYAPSDVNSFFANDYPSSFPPPTIDPYPIDGAPAPSDSAPTSPYATAAEELTLDLEWSGSMAPGATLDAVYASAPSTKNLTDAFEKALSLPGVVAISMSFGAPEASSGLEGSWASLISEAADRDITVLAATGDTGGDLNDTSKAPCSGGPAPEFPASSPKVLAVGGTNVTVDRNPLGTVTGYSEAAWSEGGGGYSTVYSAPGWQLVGTAKTRIEAAGGGRGTPDVSASAADNFLYFNGASQEAGGTSFATPLWAGLVAELDVHIGEPLGFFTDRLYHVVANETAGGANDGVVDVQGGSNCVATAGVGWDAATGWGTPRGAILNTELVGSFVNVTLAEDPSTVAPGGTLTLRAEVANWTTGAPVPDAPVVMRLDGGSSVGPCAGVFETVNTTTNGSGGATGTLPVPACFLGSHAIASAGVTTDRLYGRTSVRVAVNLLGLLPSIEWLGKAPFSYALYAGIMAVAIGTGGWLGRRRPPTPRPGVAPPVGAVTPTKPASVAPPTAPVRPASPPAGSAGAPPTSAPPPTPPAAPPPTGPASPGA